MNAIVLQTLDGSKHLGFILCALPPGDLEGDCLFSIVPDDAELFEDPNVQQLLVRRDQGESQLEVSEDTRTLTIRSHRLDDMFVHFDPLGHGQWGYIREGKRVPAGMARTMSS